jgi:hypothetical protein
MGGGLRGRGLCERSGVLDNRGGNREKRRVSGDGVVAVVDQRACGHVYWVSATRRGIDEGGLAVVFEWGILLEQGGAVAEPGRVKGDDGRIVEVVERRRRKLWRQKV